ncbi:hypothetical protein HBH98_107340 [Parastagonospora nodorum]|nr:hypothetical protein HBI13_085110 [Parastagonospora nodorum]KAH4346622.1 hypothetical protein HBH98_107340 [Parastagonospora nodorum]KAH5368573.1 hypothetical protein HBI49_090940 [Parastagonospora nodorum]KAH5499310.1 hypothetical protein HBI31_089010 [Parastagonospora nodorum]KAH5546530.1 hypothetical protein HBI25_215590 [Parastagonospora nodorum]
MEHAHFATQLNKAKMINKVVGPFDTDGRYMIEDRIVHHLIYELAAYSLDTFLTMQPSQLALRSNQASSLAEACSKNMWFGDLIAESVNLADALDFLRNGIFTEKSLSLVHNDLTPHNILVVYPDNQDARNRYPVGQWKMANFGLSFIKPRRMIQDTLSSFDKSPISDEYRGELGTDAAGIVNTVWDQVGPQKIDGISADIWSFGCILAEILTYAVEMDPKQVKYLREALLRPHPLFYNTTSCGIKSELLSLLESLPTVWHSFKGTNTGASRVHSCVELIKAIVVADPTKRLAAKLVRNSLQEIHESMARSQEDFTVKTKHVTKKSVKTIAKEEPAYGLDEAKCASTTESLIARLLRSHVYSDPLDYIVPGGIPIRGSLGAVVEERSREETDRKGKDVSRLTSNFAQIQGTGHSWR